MSDLQSGQLTRNRTREPKEFWIHLGVFAIVNAALTTANLVNHPEKIWFHWVLMGWGIGLLVHGFQVFSHGRAKN